MELENVHRKVNIIRPGGRATKDLDTEVTDALLQVTTGIGEIP